MISISQIMKSQIFYWFRPRNIQCPFQWTPGLKGLAFGQKQNKRAFDITSSYGNRHQINKHKSLHAPQNCSFFVCNIYCCTYTCALSCLDFFLCIDNLQKQNDVHANGFGTLSTFYLNTLS